MPCSQDVARPCCRHCGAGEVPEDGEEPLGVQALLLSGDLRAAVLTQCFPRLQVFWPVLQGF